jgi:hypothetical protein
MTSAVVSSQTPQLNFLNNLIFPYPSTVTKIGFKLSYILPFSLKKMTFDRKQRIYVRFIILQNFQKKLVKSSILIKEIFFFQNSDPETQTQYFRPKTRTH